MTNSNEPIRTPFALNVIRKFSLPHKYGILERLFGRKLAKNELTWVKCANGTKWKLDLRNPSHRWCVYDSIFPPEVAKWIRRHLRTGGVVIDSGANIGQAVIEFAFNPLCDVHAFEPLPQACTWLDECISEDRLKNVRVIKKGLYSTDTKLELQVAGHGDVHGAHSTLREDWYTSQNNERITIELTHLDHYAKIQGMNSIRFWKLDVEGSEFDALMGAQDLLESKRIDALYIEMNNPAESEIPEYLSSLEYEVMFVDGRGLATPLKEPISEASDYLFLPS